MKRYAEHAVVAAIVSAVWLILVINAFTAGMHLTEQTCAAAIGHE
jgi:hypothetical protein